MKRIILIVLIFFTPLLWKRWGAEAAAQFVDNFSDADFTTNPVWTGETTKFEVDGTFQLHLNAPALSDTAYLATANSVVFSDTIQWEFYFRMNFDPSNSNNLKIYLVSDQENLRGSLNGYYLRFGENGSTDRLKFFKQSGTTGTELFAGTVNSFGINPAEGRIKVERFPDGTWNFYSDSTTGNNFVLEGSVNDVTFLTTSHFGVSCKYTSSNNANFFFDDFNVTGPTFVDDILPEVTTVSITSTNSLDVIFSETVSQLTAETITNYSADNSLGNPQTATRDISNANIVHLNFATNFTPGTLYTLSISNVQDAAGNTMLSSQHPFVYYFPQRYDVVFNEVMADPTPTIGLPEFEYTELYNRTQVPINVKDWKFTYGSTTKLLPDAVILPDSFLILVSESAFPSFSFYPNAIAVEGLSTTALTNDGQILILQDSSGNIIHTLVYSIDWYGNPDKEEGGWSLEQIDPENVCGTNNNWKASTAQLGGTPGKTNSVNAANPDPEAPTPERVNVVDNTTITVFFNEKLDSLFAINTANYFIDNGIGTPLSATPEWPAMNTVTLALAQPLQVQTIYNLYVSNMQDCAANAIQDSIGVRFAIPEFPDTNDIIVNEILFYPYDDGVDFVEVYNRSSKVIDLKSLRIANFDTIGVPPINQKIIAPLGYLLFPGEYMVLTTSPDAVKSDYSTTNPTGFLKVASMPSFNIDAGSVVLNDTLGNIIDLFIYDEAMHIPLLNSFKGVSLERIAFERSSADRSNWHSAAETAGFATPAYQNSQFDVPQIEDSPITLEPEIFSPDNDGYNDVINFNYVFDTPGFIATITIYDARGRTIKNLLTNELLGTTGTISWDGINESSEKARIGIYIAYIELFNIAGEQKNYKKSFVLGGRL
ncbi:MAG: lamin tail domain-containing protein [Bacteroidia bacterium]